MMNSRACRSYRVGATDCHVYAQADDAAKQVAGRVAEIIRERQKEGKAAVLGLATGSTPVPVYRELIRLHREEGLSFQNVHSFNLDEYYDLSPEHPESYARYMKVQLFEHVDIPQSQAHVPDGKVERNDLVAACADYEKMISDLGGLDFQLLGIGKTGHIGFNEPGSSRHSRTRLVTLDPLTRMDAARDFVGLINVPRFAVTMGVGTILEAREIALLAWGKGKAEVIQRAFEGKPSADVPASLLQGHQGVSLHINETAAAQLEVIRCPWMIESIAWTEGTIKKAVHRLALREKRPILKLVDRDYQRHGLEELLSLHGPAYDLNIRVFKGTQTTITGWPGGRPGADDRVRPVPSSPDRKRIVVLCSEPGTESDGLGSTLNRLQRQGHEVRLVFLTAGTKSVREGALTRFHSLLKMVNEASSSRCDDLLKMVDGPKAREILSKHQSQLAAHQLELVEDPIFLDLPFYVTGSYRNFHPSEKDTAMLVEFLNDWRPHQIYTSGKEADPNSLEGVCWQLLEDSRPLWSEWRDLCQTWLFRVGGECWETHEIDMAVPVSPDERALKEAAIAEYPVDLIQEGSDRAADVANAYDDLGLPEYEQIEAFQLHRPELQV